MNSGDWVESLSALEYANGTWSIYRYENDPLAHTVDPSMLLKNEKKSKQIFNEMLMELIIQHIS